ncbi:MAG: S8 family serine peptidase, partial [Gammaproteobacteria bacterium]
LVVLVASIMPRTCLAVATDLSLSPPVSRTIELQPNVDANQWAAMNDLDEAEQRDNSDGSTSLSFHMPDDEWDRRGQDLCGLPGVISCGVNHCREFLAPAADFTGRVNSIEGGPVAGAMIVLVPEAPDVSQLIEEDDEEDDQSLSLGLRPGERRCSVGRGAGGPIVGSADGSGGFSLGLPAGDFDPGCWELKAGQSCEAQSVPTRTIMPEREPKRMLALLPGASGQDAQDQRDLANAAGMAAGLSVLEVLPLASIDSTLVRFEVGSGGGGSDAALIALQASPGVESAQAEQRFRTSTGGDPYAWMNYGAEQTGARRVQSLADGSGVTVAVIDTGVDTAHPELAARVVESVDVSGFGMTPDRHGTAIAGIIAAESDNGIGAYGVAPGTGILAIKACEPETSSALVSRCWSSTLAKALDRALLSDAAVINMSLGGPEDSLLTRLLNKAAEKGVLVLAAAGNDGPDAPPPFPASHSAVMAVTAVDSADRPYPGAVRGAFVDIAAPGVEIPVPSPGETYPAQLTGTSMATAHVAGAAALLLSIAPDTPADALRQGLEATAVGAADTAAALGNGRVDVCAAADRVSAGKVACSPD